VNGGAPEVPDGVVERVRVLCARLPETTVRTDRWAHSFEIRKKPFCVLAAPEDPSGRPIPMLVFRADPDERVALLATGHPFFASRSGRDKVGLLLSDETDWDEVGELVTESYRILAPKKLAALLD
jgi:hypothetical protein